MEADFGGNCILSPAANHKKLQSRWHYAACGTLDGRDGFRRQQRLRPRRLFKRVGNFSLENIISRYFRV